MSGRHAKDKERERLATLPSLAEFGSVGKIAAAARKSGLKKLLCDGKAVGKVLVVTVKALLGAVAEDADCEEDVIRATECLGLEPIEESGFGEKDLLGVEECRFVRSVASVPVVGSLL